MWAPMEAGGFLLVVRATPGGGLALPRRAAVRLEPGGGDLVLDAPADGAFRASAEAAWAYARRLAPEAAEGLRPRVEVAGAAPLSGGSAGHALALLILSALLRAPLPPHFAVGHLEGPLASVTGGLHAAPKARAAADLVRDLGLPTPVPFLYPPVDAPLADVPGLRPLRVLDPAHALRLLAPGAYARLAARHDRHRHVAAHLPGAISPLLPQAGPFALLVPRDDDATGEAEDLVVGRSGIVLYRRRAAPHERDRVPEAGRTILALDPDAR